MKAAAAILCALVSLPCLCPAQQQAGVTVQLRSCRTEFRPHDSTSFPGFSCTLELVAPAGYYMCESASLTGTIRVKDAAGTTRLAERGAIVISPDNRAFTTFTCATRPTGKRVELEGDLLVTIAKARTAHPHIAISMLENSEHRLGDTTVKIAPERANAAKTNREGGKLRCAELTMTCSPGSTIRRVERVWQGENGTLLSQPVEITPIGGNAYEMQMWDTNPTEFVRIVTVKAPQREKVRFRLAVTLGDVAVLRPY